MNRIMRQMPIADQGVPANRWEQAIAEEDMAYQQYNQMD